jgi:hypothetical protein
MLVTDLRHFLDLPRDTLGPVRRLAGHIGNIVRAAAGDARGGIGGMTRTRPRPRRAITTACHLR